MFLSDLFIYFCVYLLLLSLSLSSSLLSFYYDFIPPFHPPESSATRAAMYSINYHFAVERARMSSSQSKLLRNHYFEIVATSENNGPIIATWAQSFEA